MKPGGKFWSPGGKIYPPVGKTSESVGNFLIPSPISQVCNFAHYCSGKVRITWWNTSISFRVEANTLLLPCTFGSFVSISVRWKRIECEASIVSSMSNNWWTIEERIRYMKTRALKNLTESNRFHFLS